MNRWSVMVLAACVCVATPVVAQQVSAVPDKDTPAITVQKSAKTGERIYVVAAGDTLWSISEGLYNEPWYWPSLWSYNPQITNPHLIYPGDVVYLSRRSSPLVKSKAITFAASRFGRQKSTSVVLARRVGYISARDYRESGVIEGSREERNMLGTLDEVYVRFGLPRCSAQKKRLAEEAAKPRPPVPPGGEAPVAKPAESLVFVGPCVRDKDRYVVYRMERPVMHPVTGARLGYKINFVGEGQVINTKRKLASVVLTKAHSEVSRGDLVTNVFKPLSLVRPKANVKQIVGTIIDFHHETTATGQHSYVYIDKGAEQGVIRGNRFEIVWRGDGLRGVAVADIKDYPDEQIGIAMVVEAYDRHSLAIITHTVREIERGMAAVMARGF